MVETSVIIPTYNRLPFLKEAVASVFEQSYQDFELIVVDDGSTDATKAFAAPLGKRIKYLYQENKGPSSARNRGVGEAIGTFITFLDSDDLWQRNKLEVEVRYMKAHPEALICYSDEIWLRRGRRVNPRKKHQKYSGWIFEHCLPLCIVSPSSVLMRREFFDLVGVFDENLPACEDYDLWLRASLHLPFHYIPQRLTIKRGGHADQLSSHWGLDRYRIQSLQKLLKSSLLSEKQRHLVVNKLKEKLRIVQEGCHKRGKLEEAESYGQLLRRIDAP